MVSKMGSIIIHELSNALDRGKGKGYGSGLIIFTLSSALSSSCIINQLLTIVHYKLKGTRSRLRMRTKYITSCTRPPVWWHLQVNRSSERGLCLLIA